MSDRQHLLMRMRDPKIAHEFEAALAHHRAGRTDKAETLYRKILRKLPDHPDALHMMGVIADSRGYPQRAVQLIEKAIETIPDFADAHLNLGNAYLRAGRTPDAIASYRRAIARMPELAAAHSSLALALNSQRAFDEALTCSVRALELDSTMAQAHFHRATALYHLGAIGDAEAAYGTALSLKPNEPTFLVALAVLLMERSRFEEARRYCEAALAARPDDERVLRTLAVCEFRTGAVETALSHYRRALDVAPGFAEGWNGFGWALRALGRFDEAAECFRKALAIDPTQGEFHRSLVTTGQSNADQAELPRLSALLATTGLSVADRVSAGFALGELLDKAGQYDEAFAQFGAANALHRQQLASSGRAFNPQAFARRIDGLIEAFTPAFLASAAAGDRSALPVFIVGMPRSGTTLVEQIVSSHSRIHGAGELPDIGHIAATLPFTGTAPDPTWLTAIRRSADAHLARLRELAKGADFVTDKTPDNILHLGTIAALFPGARVIFCQRDPLDICLSNYFQLFAGGNAYSYDLADCTRRLVEIERLRVHWRRTLPLEMLDVDYECLVADLESESRRLIAFFGLDWEESCLEFHRNERIVITQSTWQVRQPLYKSSIGRWRHYEQHLGPLLDIFGKDYEKSLKAAGSSEQASGTAHGYRTR